MVVDICDVITCFKFGDDRFRGFALAEGQILPFPIDFDGRPYNTLTLPCERVIPNFVQMERLFVNGRTLKLALGRLLQVNVSCTSLMCV